MASPPTSWWLGPGWYLITALVVTGAAFFIATASSRVAVAVVLTAIGLSLGSRTRILVYAAMLAPFLGLMRRVLSGDTGRVDFDPLVVVPLVLTVVVLAFPTRGVARPRRRVLPLALVFASIALALVVVHGAFAFDVLYGVTTLVLPVLLVASIADGRTPDAWPAVMRVLPVVGVLAGAYGVLQFYVLPDWDRAWMAASELTSIGSPEPLQVRVFGGSEAPGAFAFFLGIVVVVALARALEARGAARVPWFVLAAALTFPIVLSGVRATLAGIAVCIVVLSLLYGRGLGRLLPLVLLAVLTLVMQRTVGLFGETSKLLTAERLTNLDVANDGSVQARLKLYAALLRPWELLAGDPAARRSDGMVPDVAIRFGIFAGVIMGCLLVWMTVQAVRNLRNSAAVAASLVTVFFVVHSFAGNTFSSAAGVVAAMALGSSLAARTAEPALEGELDQVVSGRSVRKPDSGDRRTGRSTRRG